MKIANLKVGVRLGAGFAAILLLLLIVVGVSLQRLGTMHTESDLTLNDRYPKVVAITVIKDNLNQIARSMRNTLIMTDPEDIAKELKQIGDDKRVIVEKLDFLDKHIAAPRGRDLLNKLGAARATYYTSQEAFIKLIGDNHIEEAKITLLNDLRPHQLAYFAALDNLEVFQKELMETSGKEVADSYGSSVKIMSGIAVLGVLMGIVIAWLISRSITGPLNEAVRVAQTVAAGDLSSNIVVNSTDETGRLLQALKDMNESLRKIVGEVRLGTDTIATASSQIASGNLDLSSRTEQQASSLEETASSMEELTSTVKQNADNAKQANSLVLTASAVAIKGGTVVAEVVNTMGSINESSRKIVDIISVIDGIAFQTNILALNAAVEAARAGEQGRGFAVVAAEVRNLAQRSAAAAKEIKTLIGDSVDKVEVGAKLVDQAGATMQEIVDSVKRVTDIMSEITAASVEQTDGIEQINQAITQMDEVTQQNAALVEEAAAAAQSLQDQAANLSQVVSVFNLGTGHGAAMMPASTAPRAGGRAASASHSQKPVTARLGNQARLATPAKRPAAVMAAATTSGGDWEEF